MRLRLAGSGRYEAVLVPDEAIGTGQAQRFVWVVDADDRAGYRKVVLGPRYEGKRIVREGLSGDDRIVVSGLQRVRPNIVVAPQEEPLAPCPSAGPLPERPAPTPSD